jgi:hypothetical protein
MPRAEISSGRYSKRHPLDWYVDPIWCARQLALALGNFAEERANGLAVWDPCCGMGNTLQAAWELADEGDAFRIRTIGSDIVDSFAWDEFDAAQGLGVPHFFVADFLEIEEAPAPCSIICNPPYSYKPNIAEHFARHALKLAGKHVCILMPSKWLASQARYEMFTDHPPLAVLHLCQRPSMPPGDMIKGMGTRAFRGGMIDYCWIVWDVTALTPIGATRAVWLPPLHRNSEIQPIVEVAHA